MRISDWSSYVCSSDLRSSAIPLIPEIYERCPVSLPRRSTRGEHLWIQPSHGPTIARNLFPEGSRLLGLGNVAARVGGVESRWPVCTFRTGTPHTGPPFCLDRKSVVLAKWGSLRLDLVWPLFIQT